MEINRTEMATNRTKKESFRTLSARNRTILATLASLEVFLILGVFLFTGCSPKIIESIRTEYKTVTDYQHDTLWRDREKIVREKGDTVFVKETETVYKTRYRDRTDTLFVRDTLTQFVEKPVEVKVPRELTWWQRTQMYGFRLILVAGLLYLGVKHRRKIFAIVRRFI